jgi:hypothetical protein
MTVYEVMRNVFKFQGIFAMGDLKGSMEEIRKSVHTMISPEKTKK